MFWSVYFAGTVGNQFSKPNASFNFLVNTNDPNAPALPTNESLLTYHWYRNCSEIVENKSAVSCACIYLCLR